LDERFPPLSLSIRRGREVYAKATLGPYERLEDVDLSSQRYIIVLFQPSCPTQLRFIACSQTSQGTTYLLKQPFMQKIIEMSVLYPA
jgi:hypothetical protein